MYGRNLASHTLRYKTCPRHGYLTAHSPLLEVSNTTFGVFHY